MRRFYLFVLAVMLTLASTAFATYQQDFSGEGMPEGFKVVEGKWHVEDGRLIGESPSGGVQGRVVFGPEMSDFVYSVDATFLSAVDSARWFSIFFRSTTNGAPPYHMFTIRHNATAQNGTELAFRAPNGNWDVRRTASFTSRMQLNQTYRIKVAVKGDYFFYFINDKLMFAASEPGYRDNGVFGLHVNGCKVAFDNILIEPYNSADFAELEKQVANEARPMFPRIVAHRGNSSVAPENTLAAIKSAIAVGADSVEIDVHATKDGEIIVMHDDTVNRTTNGTGSISRMTLEEIRELDAGSKKSTRYKGEQVPTLREVLLETKGKANLIIELKQVGIEEKVINLVNELGMENEVAIISFYAEAVRKVTQIAPEIPAAILIGSAANHYEIERIAKAANTKILDLNYSLITKTTAAYFLDRGYALWAWTVDNTKTMEQLKEKGVTVITTNVPAQAISTLRSVEK